MVILPVVWYHSRSGDFFSFGDYSISETGHTLNNRGNPIRAEILTT